MNKLKIHGLKQKALSSLGKYLFMMVLALLAVSCSKKVEVTGKVTGGSPLERIEFTEASGVATLPVINMGVNKDGNFKGDFEAPKSGMYVISYAGNQNLIYLKAGQRDRKSTRLNSSHVKISYAVFCLKKKRE